MHFFEQVFHISPDSGSGLVETLYAVTVLVIASAPGIRKLSRKWSRKGGI